MCFSSVIDFIEMNYDLSDDEFCETNFAEPSPIKKRSALLPEPKEINRKLEKLSDLKRQMKKTEAELLLFLKNKLYKSRTTSDLLKNAECDVLSLIKTNGEQIKLFPDGRPFFKEVDPPNIDSLEPSLWFSTESIYNSLSMKDFTDLVRKGFLISRTKRDEESNSLIKYCVELLKVEKDLLTQSFLLQFISTHLLSYEMANLREWDSSSFSQLLQILEKSVHSYSPKECQNLFHEGCLAALDKKEFSNTHVFPSFLAACLKVSTNEYSISEELDWLIQLELQPVECSHLLKVLPQSENFHDFGLKFAFKALHEMLKSSNYSQAISLHDLSLLLKENDTKICDLSLTAVFHILNILYYIILRLPTQEQDHAHLEEIAKCIEDLKLRYREKGSTYNVYIVNESINRFCLTAQQRLRLLINQAPVDVQCRKKLFMPVC